MKYANIRYAAQEYCIYIVRISFNGTQKAVSPDIEMDEVTHPENLRG
jgi:hypothetical protein